MTLPPMREGELRVMTYNVNFGAPAREAAVDAIAEASADVVCLQETTPEWEELLRQRLSERYR